MSAEGASTWSRSPGHISALRCGFQHAYVPFHAPSDHVDVERSAKAAFSQSAEVRVTGCSAVRIRLLTGDEVGNVMRATARPPTRKLTLSTTTGVQLDGTCVTEPS